jgi:hypothetical protein
MARARNKVLAVLAIIAAITFLLAALSVTENFLISRDIYFGKFEKQGIAYYGAASDDGKTLADLYFRVEHAQPNSTYQPMRIEWQHSYDVEVDSVTLRFRVAAGTTIFIQTDYPAVPSISYTFARNGNVYEIAIKDLGAYGEGGSIPIKFMMSNVQNPSKMTFEADFSMHYKAPLQLTAVKAHAHIDAQIPTDL